MGSLKVMLTHYEVRDELRRLGADETTDAFWRVANTDALLREVGTACQAELRKLREENRWIPVTERLPDKESYVHAATANDLFVTWWSRDGFCGVTAAVTHWRPLPKPPEVKP